MPFQHSGIQQRKQDRRDTHAGVFSRYADRPYAWLDSDDLMNTAQVRVDTAPPAQDQGDNTLPNGFPETAQDYEDLALAWSVLQGEGFDGGIVEHPYQAHRQAWDAFKAEAGLLGMANAYGIPTEQYWAYKGGEPDWKLQADEQETTAQAPDNTTGIKPLNGSSSPVDFSQYASPAGGMTLAENGAAVKKMADAATLDDLYAVTPLSWQGGTADYYQYMGLNKARLSQSTTGPEGGSATDTAAGDDPVFSAPAAIGGKGPVTVKGIACVGINAAVITSDGQVVPISQVDFDDDGAQAIYEVAAQFPDEGSAKRFLQIFQESGLEAPDFLQLYLDAYLEDMQKGADAQENGGNNLPETPFVTEDVLPYGTLHLPDETLVTIGSLFEKEKVQPPDGMDAFWKENIAKEKQSGIMETKDETAEAVGGAEEEESVNAADMFPIVMTPEQFGILSDMNGEVLGMLTDEQKQRMSEGENALIIISELDPGKQAQIEQMAQDVFASLNDQQKSDLLFLGSGLLEDVDLETRQAILTHLKNNNGSITYDDLVDLGVYEPGALAEGGITRWLQELDFGGPAHFGDLLNKEYQLSDFGTSFGQFDMEYRMKQAEQRTMLFVLMAAPLIDRVLFGPSMQSLKGENFGNNAYDNLERFGTKGDYKGIQTPYTSTEGAASPDGLAVGTVEIITEIKYKPSSGVILKANPNKTTTILGSFGKDMKEILNEMGNVKSTDFEAKNGGFNVLNVPDDMFENDNQFWDEINLKWLDKAITRGDDFILATMPTEDVLWKIDPITRTRTLTGFGREYQWMVDSGYVYDPLTSMMVRK